jgi:hypothetical protein
MQTVDPRRHDPDLDYLRSRDDVMADLPTHDDAHDTTLDGYSLAALAPGPRGATQWDPLRDEREAGR